MNQEAILWIFGTLITLGSMYLAGLSGYVLKTTGDLRQSIYDATTRVVRIETTFSLFNEKAASILHSPHTPELDSALEKLMESYEKNSDMSQPEWANLLRLTEQIEHDRELSKGERLIAAMVSTTCRVKLGMTPPGYPRPL